MAERLTLDELKSYLWGAAVLLRTHIDAGAYKQYIFPLLFFKRICDVYDEETEKAAAEYGEDLDLYDESELHTFLIPEGYHWNDVRKVTEDVGSAIVKAFREIEKANGDKMTGIFGDGAWTNKNRLPDRLLRDLVEHFSKKNLSLASCPEDELGQGYEYLIKQFADDSGHTAQEFYTNRTVVHLMTELLQPQSGESVYDPTCGSAGMLISCIAHLKDQGKEWRNLQVYGQEINQLTSAIGRMNLFLHGVEDFHIVNDDTLKNPGFIENGKLKQFDLVLANPPYSISQWDRGAFENDKYGRNLYGTPPQSRADYAFIQHIIASLNEETGRAAILLPHGVLNRNEEQQIRKAIVQSDCIDAIIGLGRHLFYNSGLESCVVLLRKNKPNTHKNSVLFIEAEKCTHKVQAQNHLFDDDIARITEAYFCNNDIPDFSRRISIDEILNNNGNLNIKLYVNSDLEDEDGDFVDSLDAFVSASNSSFSQYAAFTENSKKAAFDGCSVCFDGFDKTNWRKVKLSEVATEYSERVDDPANSDYEWYIGSDCIDGFAFNISRRQPAGTIHSAQKLFKAGDYLLVRRSLYGSDFRERAPRADFDGICSADILTIREIPGKIADGYLIAVLYSKELWQFIVSNSTGSLTRRIKWNQLKDFEFCLPPEEQQKEIVKVLWGIEQTKTAYKKLIALTDDYVKSQFIEMFGDVETNPKRWVQEPLEKHADIMAGNPFNSKGYSDDGIRICGGLIIMPDRIAWEDCKYWPTTDGLEQYLLSENDIVLAMDRPWISEGFKIAKIRQSELPSLLIQRTARIRGTDLEQDFLIQMLRQPFFKKHCNITATTVPHISMKDIGSFPVLIPPLEEQQRYVDIVQQSAKSKFEAQQALAYLSTAQKSLMRLLSSNN